RAGKSRAGEVVYRDRNHDPRVRKLCVAARVAHPVGALQPGLGWRRDHHPSGAHAKRVDATDLAADVEILGELVIGGWKLAAPRGGAVLDSVDQLLRMLGAKSDRERLGLDAHPSFDGEALEQLARGVARRQNYPIAFELAAIRKQHPRNSPIL